MPPSVYILGNSPSVLDRYVTGSVDLETFDYSCRINDAWIPIQRTHEQHMGKAFDTLIVHDSFKHLLCLNAFTKMKEYGIQDAIKNVILCKSLESVNRDYIPILNTTTYIIATHEYDRITDFLNEYDFRSIPRTGIIAIVWFIVRGFRVVIHGFDLHGTDKRQHLANLEILAQKHNPVEEAKFLKRLIDENRLLAVGVNY